MKDYNIINIELIKQIQTGNKEAWEELIKNNIGIINKRVNYFSERTKYLTPEDLFQEAAIGLYQAAIRYDLSRDNTFLTYALYYRKIARKLHPTIVGCEMNCSDIF